MQHIRRNTPCSNTNLTYSHISCLPCVNALLHPLQTPFREANALNCVTLDPQGIPFFHAGDDLLRSKSLDRDSYNSGDWFNRLDWSCASNNWGVGLPPASKNESQWGIKGPLLARKDLAPGPELIAQHREQFLELLRIRCAKAKHNCCIGV